MIDDLQTLIPGLEEALRLIGEGREIYAGDHATETVDWGDEAIKQKLKDRLAESRRQAAAPAGEAKP